ncbi:MAG: tetratricopeptide repeat protein [bacterium]|nr:tetratricopeptide repeat protein [bacterium]
MKLRQSLPAILILVALLSGCASDPDAQKQKFLEVADRYLERGDYRTASLVYRKVIQIDGRFPQAYYRLGLAELRAGRIRQGMNALMRANTLMPEHRGAFTRLAGIYLAVYKANPAARERVLADLNKLLEDGRSHHEGTFEWNRIRGQIELATGNPEGAAELFAKAEEIQSDAGVTLARAKALMGTGKKEEAVEVVRRSLRDNLNHGPSYDFLYWSYLSDRRLEEAQQVLVAKFESDRTNVRSGLDLAAHYWLTQQRDEAYKVLTGLEPSLAAQPMRYAAVGDFYLRIRDLEGAGAAYDKGLELVPDRAPVFQKRLAQLAAVEGESAEAMEMMNEYLADSPNDTQALALRAALHAQDRDPEAAIADLKAGVESKPRNHSLRYRLGRAYLRQRKVDEAIGQFEEALRLRPNHVPARYGLAAAHLGKRDFAQIVTETDRILQARPDHTSSLLLRARARALSGDRQRARADVDAVLARRPDHRGAKLQLAALDLADQQFQSAESGLRALLEAKPDDRTALTGLLRALVAQRRFAEAERLLRGEIQRSPKNLGLHQALAAVLVRNRDYDKTITELETILAARPDNAQVRFQIGRVHHLAGRLTQAETYYREALGRNLKGPLVLYFLGMVVEARGDTAGAVNQYNAVLQLSPDHFHTNIRLARLLAAQNIELDRAQSLAENARRRQPASPEAADALAWVYFKKGLTDSAIQLLEPLVRQHPDKPLWRYHLAEALFGAGDSERAGKELQTALKADPSLRNDPHVQRLADAVI